MKLLLFNFGAYTHIDIKSYFDRAGINYDVVGYSFADKNHDDFFVHKFSKYLTNGIYDAVFSVNYFPLVAECCHKDGMKYISWSYDNPLNVLNIEETLGFETNYVFLFDKVSVDKYISQGFNNVYHMPLAVDSKRLEKITLSRSDIDRYSAEVGFVGKLYDSDLPIFLSGMNDYQKGFIESTIQAQKDLYGCYMIDRVITDDFVAEINAQYKALNENIAFQLTKSALSYAIAAETTRRERLTLLAVLSSHFNVKIYSRENNQVLSKAQYMGTCGYMDEMPKVFKASKINLNINLKISQSGVPLRVMDILGCGGFVLSSWQPEIAEYFEDGKEVVLYESIEDAFEKTSFYIKHDDIREQIAKKGHEKVSDYFSYDTQFEKIFKIVGIE